MPDATRHLTLANGLQLTLRHAPRLKRSAAALRVHAGSHDAPTRWPGLAHFLEHLFFLGTSRFPLDDGLMRYAIDSEPELEGALIAIDPSTGEVKAMVGGVDFRRSQFNRAVQARRQPGSAFKPFIYAAAIDHGYTAATMVTDAPISLPDGRRALSSGNVACLWDLATGRALRVFGNPEVGTVTAAFSPDGRQVLVGGVNDAVVTLWDVESGTQTNRFDLAAGRVIVAFAPDGRRAWSGSNDGTVRLWDLASVPPRHRT